MSLFYYRVKNFLQDKIDMPKELKSIIPEGKLEEYRKEYKSEVNESISSANVIILDLGKFKNKDVTIPDIDLLRELKLPFNNFFIEIGQEDKVMGIHVRQTVKNELEIYNYAGYPDGTIIPVLIIVDLEMLPRFYVACTEKCERFIPTKHMGLLNNQMCMRTHRTAEFCSLGTMAMLTIDIVNITLHELNKKPEYIKSTSLPSPTPLPQKQSRPQHKKQSSKPQQQFIYLNKDIKVTEVGEGDGERKKGTPKSPHTRRGHYRHYKNGKVVWIKPTKVRGGKNKQKFYKI